MTESESAKILCVDDEPAVLEGLTLHLRRKYQVSSASTGAEALELLAKEPFAVVLCDMRMPGIGGIELLARVRKEFPDVTRMLITGAGDVESAAAAINEGQIFRFLSKPCPAMLLMAAVEAAVEQHRLVTAERVLLEQTLHGSIKALTEVLALTNPACFGRATRIKLQVSSLATKLRMREKWQLEVAAMLSQLGYVSLPPDTVEKVYYGEALSDLEQKMVAKVPTVTEQLLANIPRLEVIREILATYPKPPKRITPGDDPKKVLVERSAQILRVAIDFDALEAQGASTTLALDTMRGRNDKYDPGVITALAGLKGTAAVYDEVRELPLSGLRVGMVLAEDVKMLGGSSLLVARGFEVTEGFVERVRNFRPGTVKEPVRVIVKGGR